MRKKLLAAFALPSAIAAAVGLGVLSPSPKKTVVIPVPVAQAAPATPAVEAPSSNKILLTGELDAVSSDNLVVPKTPQWNLSIRWLEADGAVVQAGQKVAELDNSAFANNLEEQKLAAIQSENELAAQVAQNAIATADRKFQVDKERLALEKAKLEASVAPDTLPKRVYQQKQLDKERAETALAKALDELEAQTKAAALDVKVRQIAIDKSKREIQAAEAAIESVVLRAPKAGIVVIADHPWEGRKLEVGDNMWVGIPVVRLPDLAAMKVNALLSDVDDGAVSVGMKANAFLDAYPDTTFPGTVTAVSPVAREPSQRSLRRSFMVTVALEKTDLQKMLPGMSVRVEIEKTPTSTTTITSAAVNMKPANKQSQHVEPKSDDWLTVKRDDLVLDVEVTGKLAAVSSDLLGPPGLPEIWDYKIAMMAPEGATVKKGDPVLAFDSTELRRKLEQKENERDAIQKEIERATANAKMTRRDEELRISEAEAKLRKAELKVDRPTDLTGSIELATAKLDLELSKQELEYQQKKAEATHKLDDSNLAMLRGKLARAETRINETKSYIARMTIGSPRAATVIYASNNWNDQKKKVGDTAWRQEKVIETAALDEMIAKGEIDEVDAAKAAVGQRVTFKLDAVPDVTFGGTVKAIGKTVQRQSKKNPLKVMKLEIVLDKTDSVRMRPGMRFRGAAETARIKNTLMVPSSAVFVTVQGPVAYKKTRSGFEAMPLKLGNRNKDWVEVLGGLQEGDAVSRVDLSR